MTSNVEFEEDQIGRPSPQRSGGGQQPSFSPQGVGDLPTPSSLQYEPKMVQWLIRRKLAGSPQTANAILIGVVVFNIVVVFVVVTFFL